MLVIKRREKENVDTKKYPKTYILLKSHLREKKKKTARGKKIIV